jgi:3-dehydroquinate dehydratase/shikimate dehydrogenase
MTSIVAPIFVRTPDAALPQIAAAAQQGADMVELRCDEASEDTISVLLTNPEVRRKPVILTLRAPAEGGLGTDAESARLQRLIHACQFNPDYVDIEYNTWQANPQFVAQITPILAASTDDASGRPKLILSNHDFSTRPPGLRERLLAMARIKPACIIKAAYKAADLADALEALRLYQELPQTVSQSLVIIAMGEAGLITRLLAAKYNAAFTFAVPAGLATTAPGQPLIADLIKIYRFHQQQLNWPVFGVIGWPVSHSISPMIHNAGFQAIDFPGVYIPLPIAPEYGAFLQSLETMRRLPGLNLRGVSVTIPHKANAARYLAECGGEVDDTSGRIGVLNTLFFPANGIIKGTNSDWCGALDALQAGTGWSLSQLVGKKIAVLGAGGAARAIVAGLASVGASVVVYNRTLARAQELAFEFNGKAGPVVAASSTEFSRTQCQVVINCTPAGMTPHIMTLPMDDPSVIHAGMVVFDTVYNPRRTRLLEIAAARGAVTIEGLEMLLRQAAVQFAGFTHEHPPLAIMRMAGEGALQRG